MTRYEVIESYGYGHRDGIRINERTAPRNLAESTVRGLIRELKQWASGYADTVSDVTGPETGVRLITGHHWINGYENIRQLSIKPVTE